MRVVLNKIWRFIAVTLARGRSEAEQVALERRLRGKEEARKLALADCVIVSFGKSGRTWVRMMLSRFYQVRHGLAERHLIGFDNLHRKNPAIPRLFFTHDNYLKDFTGNADSKADYYGKKVILLVRDPADTAVSQYFQWRFRMRPRKKLINDYPAEGVEMEVYDFVMSEDAGLPKILGFMNLWADEAQHLEDLLIVRYEDLRADPGAALGRMLEFIGTPGEDAEIAEAVEFSSVDNMRAREAKGTFWLSGSRMVAKDKSNPDSFKVRRAKVGGYRDYFSDEEARAIDACITDNLRQQFGYERADVRQSLTGG